MTAVGPAWRTAVFGTLLLHAAGDAVSAPLPDELLQAVRDGNTIGVIVEFDTAAIDRDTAAQRNRLPRHIDDDAALARQATRYRSLKDNVMRSLPRGDVEAVRDYSQLPLSFKRVKTEAGLRALASQPGVTALHPDRLHQHVLAESLPLVGQPTVAAAGLRGAGSTVVVIDNGIELTNAAFGGCTAVGTPSASCRIADLQDIATAPTSDHRHGTNVAAIVVGIAPDARVASLNVFGSSGAFSSDIIAAINWAITNRSRLNIVAVNMSLGDSSHNTSACSRQNNPYLAPIANARNAGISVAVAAGNGAYVNGSYVDGIASPACTPGAMSVGAVYDSAMGGLKWAGGSSTECTDLSIVANQTACFSQDASTLTLLAPGAMVSAGGYSFGGTSQAAPHVAGAIAVLRAGFPNETLAAIEARLTEHATALIDARSGRSHPRLNLLAAARPLNDDFAHADTLGAGSGTLQSSNRLATIETGEPQPAATTGQSVWWRWTAPATGQVSLDTAASAVDTRLDVYTGSTLDALIHVAGNDNASATSSASALRFQATAGITYQWAVDAASGSAGDLNLNWALDTSAQANLSVALGGPSTVLPGSTVVYTVTVANAGPQSATGVAARLEIPSGIAVVAAPEACTVQGSVVTCSAGEVLNGASVSYAISLRIDSLAAPVSLSASLLSEVPDPTTTDNAATASLTPDGSDIADIPALPEWGVLLLGALLLSSGGAIRRQASSAPVKRRC